MSKVPAEMDPYAVLGIPHDSPPELIEVAYEFLSKRYPAAVMASPLPTGSLRPQIDHAYQALTSKSKGLNAIRQTAFVQTRRHISMAVSLSRNQLPILPEPQTLYARVDLSSSATIKTEELVKDEQQQTGRLNLTLVLDRSNSMQGSRLDRVKGAAYQVIDNMDPEDVLSVVAFSDRANVIIPAVKATDKPRLKAQIALLGAFGGTELYHGLSEGLHQNREFFDAKYVNHLLIITDGNTYGDESQCLELATNAGAEGIGISAMGIGTDWNDDFLDQIASATGGVSQFIRSIQEVGAYINNHVRHLSNTFAERVRFILRLADGIEVEHAFKIAPIPQPVEITSQDLRIGTLESERATTILLQFRLPPNLSHNSYRIGRLIVVGDILTNRYPAYHNLVDMTLPTTTQSIDDHTPTHVLDALSRLALYRMQESANDAIKRGDIVAATQRLERLATRLLAIGQSSLATHVLQEAQIVKDTHMLSADGKKTLKYHTRQLMMAETSKYNVPSES